MFLLSYGKLFLYSNNIKTFKYEMKNLHLKIIILMTQFKSIYV